MGDDMEEIVDYQEDGEYYEENSNKQSDENEPEEMQKRVLEMEEELEQLSKLQQQVEYQISSASDKIDENSIYIGQVEYEATPEELREHFASCGVINRITIMCDKITGQAKGFAYIEFTNKEAVDNALALDDSEFKGRQLKVLPKRQNIPVMRGGGRGGRGRNSSFGGRAPPNFRGGFRGSTAYRGGGRFQASRGGPPQGGRFGRRGGGRSAPAYFNAYY